ncbi:hypothetical protein [Methylobacterium phyllostachyos]|nr:hypothetical protein [Methylobacterium phyllostachyos]
MRMPIPTAEETDVEVDLAPETPQQRRRRAAREAAARTADWRARRAEEEAAVRRQAARDAAIVDALVTAGYIAEQVSKRTGTAEEPSFTIKDVLRVARDKLEHLGMSRAEALRQLHGRLAPGVACPF